MEDKSNIGSASERSSGPTGDSKPLSPDELIISAQEYFSSDFPNSERLDCPTQGTLSALVSAGRLPDDQLRAHLFGCSECFREYHTSVLARDRQTAVQAVPSWSHRLAELLVRLPIPVYAACVALVLLSCGGFYLWQWRNQRSVPAVVRNGSTGEDANASKSTQKNPNSPPTLELPPGSPPPLGSSNPANPQSSPLLRPSPGSQSQGELLAIRTVEVDLENYTALRGRGTGANAIKLSRSRISLKLKLPEGSAKGLYSLSIIDSSGRALVTAQAHSADGNTLNVALDARKLAPQKYRLRVLRDGEAPEYYPVVVSEEPQIAPD